MFYEKQPLEKQQQYKQMLSIIGNLTLLFSENKVPYLPYRAHENIFCKYFLADNLARYDCSADAKYGDIGIGLKTWVGNDDQKVAEFGKLRETYKDLSGIELIKQISEYRNERIRVSKKIHGINEMIYHVIKRNPGQMQIIECAFDEININKIKLLPNRGNKNNTYFNDEKHTYHFSTSKNTLYMIFESYDILDEFEVEIMTDPFNFLMNLSDFTDMSNITSKLDTDYSNKLCLRLYSESKSEGKFVPEKSGLNQWNASGRVRNPNEIYIPYPAFDRSHSIGFFPPRDENFELSLPDGTVISAKVCQSDGKAIMSNPNKVLGEWLLRNVFELPEGTLITYEMLEKFGIDSVIFTKTGDKQYRIDFSEIGTYEDFYNHSSNLE